MCHQSPAKLLRSVIRITKFLEKKPRLSMSPQQSISIIPPKPSLEAIFLPNIDFPPIIQRPKLEFVKFRPISIPPRLIYHPAIINACKAMFAKHPSVLLPEEVDEFNFTRNHAIQIGEPLETNEVYLPNGGVRTCLNCGHLT
jgi:hypothetical protein